MTLMQESLDRFSSRLLGVHTALEEQKDTARKAEQRVFALLEAAAHDFEGRTSQNTGNQGEHGNVLRETIDRVFTGFTEGILRWKEAMAERSEVRKKLEEMGSGLIVAVFGRTNAGKSTLGNFLRGKQLLDAPFDNAWKHADFSVGPITVIEKGKDSVVEINAKWFAEGGVETTREAQIFQLPGLLWLDTPGFGSMNDESLGNLARKYVERADLIIYLDDSDDPGLENITQSLLTILREGHCTLIAINHSDKNERVKTADGKTARDANGKILQRRVAKSKEDRQKQEEYLVRRLKRDLPEDQRVEAISMSLLLAKQAVAEGSDEVYAASNIDALFSRILRLIPDNTSVLTLKYRDALHNCIHLIDMVLGEEGSDEQTLVGFDRELAVLEGKIAEHEQGFDVENETRAIVAPVLLNIRSRIKNAIREAESGRGRIDVNLLIDDAFSSALHNGISKKSKVLLKDLWLETAASFEQKFPPLGTVELTRQRERHTYEVTETESYERSPEGVIETVCSWFGKSYYGRRTVKRVKEQIIDLGFSTEEAFATISREIEASVTDVVRKALEEIRHECLVRGAERVHARREILRKAMTGLREERAALAALLPAVQTAGEDV
ncbi:MAG: GTPase domain-containing protein [Desulfovibrionaceae bacterium]|nr:GTPase domain-containing protein [Desulfovibrionaceae bacterium]